MTPKNMCTPLDLGYIKNNPEILPREYLNFCEYRRLETDCLRQNCVAQLQERVGGEKNFSLSVTRGGALKGYMLFEYLPYDSAIFEFNIYRISDFCFFGRDDIENQNILETILFNLQEKKEELNIKYITFPLNANIPTSTLLVNCLMENKFYYIDSLIVFKMQKHEYKDIVLPKKNPAEITIRRATVEDEAAIFELAKKSYKIDRYHLDKHLSREKCDEFYANSAQNTVQGGFTDVIIIAEYKNEIVGYFSAKKSHNPILNATYGVSLLSAVAEEVRGLGVFSLMNNHLLKWYHENTDIAEMGTYLTNVPVHRAWTNNGLSLVRVSFQLARYFGDK